MKNIYIVAGGTGGHINAALSMGEAFEKDYKIKFLSGTRYLDYQLYKNHNCLHLETRPLRGKNLLLTLVNILFNLKILFKILFEYSKTRPKFIIGAGGYVCGPTLLAGKILGIPIFIIEQNAIAGMTNKLLAKFSDLIFTNFEKTKGITQIKKVRSFGNPIRAKIKYSKNQVVKELNLLVFGGSLGAEQINEMIRILLSQQFNFKLNIYHQVGKNNKYDVPEIDNDKTYRQVEYIENMSEAYAWSNLIISRAGASTISELRVVKRPTILIPFPKATDNHQYYNALELKKENYSFIEILDHKKSGDELASDVKKAIDEIWKEKKFYQNESKETTPSTLIKQEIEKYVWN
ncbi:MAG: UDP-N-acetylglucosamine--N-acetylmuramyl-(pentapeptide) pyrophosphoryl-undecaprenol N-acetylglucosamine transferase [Bacteriovoracaceae bacterium]|jgi:UDP-N-acetylglucosamine--N-acetylmuramyl-(pentapeptide) pyrophosphoryl-undecaprenol N-acetylglucosamine transferase|nr:UDP-N-acetylglucosamine--N-acetylmuramyl-(pentapeptide) pyrophosphoryl-undecaprenol N-acetylglucosamine transferase [Bacteriovoracaceae bacterium]